MFFSIIRCEQGVLSSCYPSNVLMTYQGTLPFVLPTDLSTVPIISLREAAGARKLTHKCNCRGNCENKRYPCKSAGIDCSTHCHPKQSVCKNRGDLKINKTDLDCKIPEANDNPVPVAERRKRKLEARSARASKKKKVTTDDAELSDEFLDVVRKGEWLTDEHILVVSNLLKEQFPVMNGLYDAKYGADLSFPHANHSFVQIVHVSNCHWATVASSSSSSVRFYDSLFPTMSSRTKAQVAAIMNTNESKIQVMLHKTQFQKGGTDYGLFAIAYAVDLCLGVEPADVRYEQESLRSHLLQCFQIVSSHHFRRRS